MAPRSRQHGTGPLVPTARDLSVLIDLVRFGPLRVDQLAARHEFPSERAVRDRMATLIAAGLLERYKPKSYRPTRRGTRITGLDLSPLGDPRLHLAHDQAVADLAFWLLSREPGSQWITERELKRDLLSGRHGGRGFPEGEHVPDGKLVSAEHRAAIELELHSKRPERYVHICRWFAQALAYDRFRWYVDGEALARQLTECATRHDLADLMTVEQLPSSIKVFR
jgi:hypothetical protein